MNQTNERIELTNSNIERNSRNPKSYLSFLSSQKQLKLTFLNELKSLKQTNCPGIYEGLCALKRVRNSRTVKLNEDSYRNRLLH